MNNGYKRALDSLSCGCTQETLCHGTQYASIIIRIKFYNLKLFSKILYNQFNSTLQQKVLNLLEVHLTQKFSCT